MTLTANAKTTITENKNPRIAAEAVIGIQSSVLQFILYHKHYPLGDIRRMVGNTFHIFGNHQIIHILRYVLRFLLHYCCQMLTHFGKVIVNLIIGSNNLVSLRRQLGSQLAHLCFCKLRVTDGELDTHTVSQ